MAAYVSFRVLIADDDPLHTLRLRAQLTSLGHQVIAEVADGKEALLAARKLRPDLVVMNVKMPGVDGLEVSRQIDQDNLCPIVLFSAYSEAGLVQRVRSLSWHAYLVRPFDERDIELAIELALKRFRRLRQGVTQLKNGLDTCSVLERATEYLVTHRHCSPQEAQRWIQQEARAKRSRLDEVANAIVAGEMVAYHYSVPT